MRSRGHRTIGPQAATFVMYFSVPAARYALSSPRTADSQRKEVKKQRDDPRGRNPRDPERGSRKQGYSIALEGRQTVRTHGGKRIEVESNVTISGAQSKKP